MIFSAKKAKAIILSFSLLSTFSLSAESFFSGLTGVKINANDPGNMTIPTEIFIEDPPAMPEPDLFTVTDPFLDDNDFELENSKVRILLETMAGKGTEIGSTLEEIKSAGKATNPYRYLGVRGEN